MVGSFSHPQGILVEVPRPRRSLSRSFIKLTLWCGDATPHTIIRIGATGDVWERASQQQ